MWRGILICIAWWFGISKGLGWHVCTYFPNEPRHTVMCYTSALLHSALHGVVSSALLLAYAPQPPIVECVDGNLQCDLTVLSLQCFVGFLVSDAMYVFACYPLCGGMDMVVHHVGFSSLALVAMYSRVYPLIGNVLLFHEWSSVFLNLRWFVVRWKSERAGVVKTWVEILFAASYFLLRIALFVPFVLYTVFVLLPRSVTDRSLSFEVASAIASGLIAAQALYGYWFVRIVRRARRERVKFSL